MNDREYAEFVRDTDQAKDIDVALYGIAGELGSVVSAVKRRLIAKDETKWDEPNEEIIEELGDLMWYCFAFANCHCSEKGISSLNVLAHDIANLEEEIDSDNERAQRIGEVLDPAKRAAFLAQASKLPGSGTGMQLDDYQEVAFLTARTEGRTLVVVCLAVLSQLCAELFRIKLPDVELTLNKNVADRPVEDVLGEMAWHIAAIASLYDLKLNDIAETNKKKASRRFVSGDSTALYDENDELPECEKFPRRFQVCFVSVSSGRLQMYYEGKQLGAPLTDNAAEDDGYRYHDVLHLAFVAKLGWSPVLRSLMGRKRKSDPELDEFEDGARAYIMEEAVINAIHAEGERQAKLLAPDGSSGPARLFGNRAEVSFDLLRLVENFVRGHEVTKSQYWEWVDAIYEGCKIFHQLREEGQGTVSLDLEERSIRYRRTVHVGLDGYVAALGSVANDASPPTVVPRETLIGRAILNALGINDPSEMDVADIEIDETSEAGLAVKAEGRVQEAMWDQGVVEFRIAFTERANQTVSCTAIGIGDPT